MINCCLEKEEPDYISDSSLVSLYLSANILIINRLGLQYSF